MIKNAKQFHEEVYITGIKVTTTAGEITLKANEERTRFLETKTNIDMAETMEIGVSLSVTCNDGKSTTIMSGSRIEGRDMISVIKGFAMKNPFEFSVALAMLSDEPGFLESILFQDDEKE